jgi:hypothetical protein
VCRTTPPPARLASQHIGRIVLTRVAPHMSHRRPLFTGGTRRAPPPWASAIDKRLIGKENSQLPPADEQCAAPVGPHRWANAVPHTVATGIPMMQQR